MDFVLAEALNNIQRDQNDDHSMYDLFGSKDIKDVTKVLGDTMKPEALEHVFCISLQLVL